MLSVNNLTCYGSAVIIELTEKDKDTCIGVVISVGTTSTIKLQNNDIVYFNYNNIDSEIIINEKQYIAIQHYKIFGYIKRDPIEKLLGFEDLKTAFKGFKFKEFEGKDFLL